MDEFDDILRRKLNEPVTPPEHTLVWSKINKALSGASFNKWKTIALSSLLLWLLTMAAWMNSGKNISTKILNTSQAKMETLVKYDTIFKIQEKRDTVIKKIYITKWKTIEPSNIDSKKGIMVSQLENNRLPTNAAFNSTAFNNYVFIPSLKISSIQSSIMEYKTKIVPLRPVKTIEIKPNLKKIPVFSFGIWTVLPKYKELVSQKSGIAPKISSSIYNIAGNYLLLKGLSFTAGINRQKDAYEAAGITDIKDRKSPSPGDPTYTLDALTINQLIWGLNTGVSYELLLKNKWMLSMSAGMDWILSGKQDNSYCYPGSVYKPEKRIYEHLQSKPMTGKDVYLSLGLDVPVYRELFLGVRFKKFVSMTNESWLVPDYSTDFGLKYCFY